MRPSEPGRSADAAAQISSSSSAIVPADQPAIPSTPTTALWRRLHALSMALAGAATTSEVAGAAVAHGLLTTGAQAAILSVLSPNGRYLDAACMSGFPEDSRASMVRIELERVSPLAEAARTGRPVFVETAEERAEHYPATICPTSGCRGALATLPLAGQEGTLGALGIYCGSGRTIEEDERAFLMVIGQMTALALERAQLFDAERAARQEAQEQLQRRVEAEEELRHSRERYQTISEHLSDFAFAATVNPDMSVVIEWITDPVERVLGWRPDEIVGESLLGAVHPDDRDALIRCGLRCIEEGVPGVSEHRVVTRSGESRWLRSYFTPMRSEDGQVVRLLGAAQDTTAEIDARRQAEESEALYRSLINSLPQIIWTQYPNGDAEFYNDFWYEYTGLPRDGSHTASDWDQVLHPDDRDSVLAIVYRQLSKGEPWEAEYRVRSLPDGEYRWFLARCVPVRSGSGHIVRWIGSATDVHAHRQAEQEISSLNERLRWTLTETHHRVKNNLQVVSAMIDMQSMVYDEAVPLHVYRRLGTQIRALATVHDSLTHQAKESSDSTRASAEALLSRLASMLQSAQGGLVRFRSSADALISAREAGSLALVAAELATNSQKHGAGQVEMALGRVGGDLSLVVTDDGPGFPDDFEPDAQGSTGLELVRTLVTHDLRGTLTLGNGPNGGARVAINFTPEE